MFVCRRRDCGGQWTVCAQCWHRMEAGILILCFSRCIVDEAGMMCVYWWWWPDWGNKTNSVLIGLRNVLEQEQDTGGRGTRGPGTTQQTTNCSQHNSYADHRINGQHLPLFTLHSNGLKMVHIHIIQSYWGHPHFHIQTFGALASPILSYTH